MKIGKKMQDAINKQINAELYSAYLYLSMSANFEDQNLKGMANWMKVQAMEEMTHANKLYAYLIERGAKVELEAIEKPPKEWKTPIEAFQAGYEHEQKVTAMIDNLVDIADQEKDRATASMLRWFVDEQVEEESNAEEIVQKLKMIDEAPGALFMIDKELGTRVFVDETAKGSGGE